MALRGYGGVDAESVRLADDSDPGTKEQRRAFKQAVAGQQNYAKDFIARGGTREELGIRPVKEEGLALWNFLDNEDRTGGTDATARHFAEKNVQAGHWTRDPESGGYLDYNTEADKAAGNVRGRYDAFGRPLDGAQRQINARKLGAVGGSGPSSFSLTGTGQPGTTGTAAAPQLGGGPGLGGGPNVTPDALLQKVLNGQETSMNQKVVNALEARAKRRADQMQKQGARQLDLDAVRRGVFNSKSAAGQRAGLNRDVRSELSDQVTQIGVQKAQSDFQDRMGALDRAQRSLDSARQYALAQQGNALQREQMLANIKLAEQRIAEERNSLTSRMNFDREMAFQNNAWQNERWQQELPFRTAEFENSILR